MTINLDLNQLSKVGLSPNDYVYLYCLFHNVEVPYECAVNTLVLERKAFLKLTEKGCEIRQKTVDLFSSSAVTVSDWVDEWRTLFPIGVKSGGYPVRGDRQSCLKKMANFVKKYPEYTKTNIFDATQAYIDLKRRDGWSYMQLSHYFIEKDGVSNLAALCDEIIVKGVPEVKEAGTTEGI